MQEARALAKEVIALAAADPSPRRLIVFLDSSVCVGAFAKGRSSSFRLNGIIRALSGHLILAGIELVVIWVSSGANPADHPSRGRPLPPPSPPPPSFEHLFPRRAEQWSGIELFAGAGIITKAMREAGFEMEDPVDIKNGPDYDLLDSKVFDDVVQFLVDGGSDFCWLAPPCYGHSAAQNGRKGGPLRTREKPEGIDPELPIVKLTNIFWECAIKLFKLCVRLGIDCFIEHPVTAFSWRARFGLAARRLPGVQ